MCQVFPARPQPLVGGGRFTLCGKLESETASITLQYGVGSNVTRKVTVELSYVDLLVFHVSFMYSMFSMCVYVYVLCVQEEDWVGRNVCVSVLGTTESG